MSGKGAVRRLMGAVVVRSLVGMLVARYRMYAACTSDDGDSREKGMIGW